jgi:uncharacterized C2H2 Zn-finger protein
MWKIKKIIGKGEYNYALVKEHPNATKNGYVLYHRIIVENHINRLLDKNEIVHHINGDKKDNRIENLEIMLANEHSRIHALKGEKYVKLKCPSCDKIFERSHHNTHLAKGGKYSTCSNSCRGKVSRYIQLNGYDKYISEKISGNIIEIYKIYQD